MNNSKKVITKIEATTSAFAHPEIRKRKVAAYARVSTDYADQLNSYKVQCDEYTTRITSNPHYIYAGLFADQGLSGTQAKKRPEFMKMIEAARNGEIDLILTKSISRFGRNTVDVITYIRELRELNVEIFFEKENISSLDPKIDFMLTILSSIAQEESRSISANVKWAIEKKARNGIVDPRPLYGYDVIDGKYSINEPQAKVIKEIFNLALIGYNINDIVKTLNEEGHLTLKGSTFKYGTVRHILQNEKYCGDALLRKTVCIDYLTKKVVPNDNIVDKYYVSNNHEGIITRELFNSVQAILNSRKKTKTSLNKTSKYPLTGILYCPKCKRTLKRQHLKSGTATYVVLNCNHSYHNTFNCDATSPLYDLVYGAAFEALQTLLRDENKLTKVIKTFNNEDSLEKLRLEQETVQQAITRLHQTLNDKHDEKIIPEIKEHETKLKEISKQISIETSSLVKVAYLKSLANATLSAETIKFKDVYSLIFATDKKIRFIIAPRQTLDELLENTETLLNAPPLFSKMHLAEDERRGIFFEVVLYA